MNKLRRAIKKYQQYRRSYACALNLGNLAINFPWINVKGVKQRMKSNGKFTN